ncbi:hypothetical protein SDC9_196364 [bioreactor metagenome]|uniref:Uncharacterized protein n=1 Tax=bioreactor metagenome TaxID=1076179 RepID=A0A645ID56_9ZZZZ
MDVNLDLSGVALDLNLGDTRVKKTFFEIFSQLVIFNKDVAESVVLGKPAGIPILDYAYSKTMWIDFLAHSVYPPLSVIPFLSQRSSRERCVC